VLTQYRYFVAIVDHGGMTAAATALGISQPAITRSLQALEFQIGAKLLERRTGVPALTPTGELVLRRARILLAEQRSLLEDVAALSANADAVTYVNGSPMTAVALLPRILARMAASHPDIRVSVRGDNGANYDWKRDALLQGEIDVALTIFDPALHDDSLIQLPLFVPDVKIIVGRNHPAAGKRADLGDLLDDRWILPPLGSSPRMVLENEFRARGLQPPRDSIEISDWRIALDLVHETRCVTAIPFHPACFDDQFERFHILPIAFSVRPLGIYVVMRTLAMHRRATASFVDTAREVVAQWAPKS